MLIIKVVGGPGAGATKEVDGEVVIGRDGADLTIDDSELSRRHAVIRSSGDGLVVEDLGSRNGTLIDGRRISGPTPLPPGARLEVGATVIQAEAAPKPEAEAAPEPAGDTAKKPSKALLIGGVAVLAILAAIAVVALAGGDDDESGSASDHRLTGRAVTAVISPVALKMTIAGQLRARPVGTMAFTIRRSVAAVPSPGGKPVPLVLQIGFAKPGGSFNARVDGTVRVTAKGVEVVRGTAKISGGTGTFDHASGNFKLVGDNPGSATVSNFTLGGTINY